jgi:ABC-type bacteriocin/lantibiotic exporter with double-glycine peptidase domain
MPAPWLPVSHQKQYHRSDCLAACAAMVLAYLGRSAHYSQLMKLLAITPDLGAPASNIRRLEALKISVEYGRGDMAALAQCLARNFPCIAFVHTIHLSYWAEAVRHAVVVVGLDEQQVYLYDPFFGAAPQTVSRLEFELAWDEMDNTYAVVTT